MIMIKKNNQLLVICMHMFSNAVKYFFFSFSDLYHKQLFEGLFFNAFIPNVIVNQWTINRAMIS